jgi:hypothetical protein
MDEEFIKQKKMKIAYKIYGGLWKVSRPGGRVTYGYFCGRSIAGIPCSSLAEGTDVSLFCVLCR